MPNFLIEETYVISYSVEADDEDDAIAMVESLKEQQYMLDHAELESRVIERAVV